METIQVVLDTPLLKAADLAAKRQKVNRSALIRQAPRNTSSSCRSKKWRSGEQRAYQSQPHTKEEWVP